MVRAVTRSEDANVPVTPVRAHRGKYLRAEPIAALYEQGRVKHVDPTPAVGVRPDAKPLSTFAGRTLAELEDQMCDFGLDGRLSSGGSPDRLDALVWAVTELTEPRPMPRVRVL